MYFILWAICVDLFAGQKLLLKPAFDQPALEKSFLPQQGKLKLEAFHKHTRT